MDSLDNIKNLDTALFNLATSGELWIVIGAVIFLFFALYLKKIIDARSARMFGRQRFLAQSDVAKNQVYWFGNATGACPWVLIDVSNDYLRFEDKTRVRHIPTKSFPDREWTISKVLSPKDVLDGSWMLRLKNQSTIEVDQGMIEGLVSQVDALTKMSNDLD